MSQSGQCPRNDCILSGFEHMDFLWVKYRREHWRPSDDLMFPEQEANHLPEPPPASSPPKPTGGKRKSKAIPIVRPDGTIATPPGKAGGRGRGEVKNDRPITGVVVETTTNTSKDMANGEAHGPEQTLAKPGPTSTATTKATTVRPGVPSSVEDPFITRPTALPPIPILPDRNAPSGSPAWRAWVSLQARTAPFPPPSPTRPQSWPRSPQPILAAPLFFAKTSTGEPADAAPPKAASIVSRFPTEAAFPSADGCASNNAITIDSHSRRMAELNVGVHSVPCGSGQSDDRYADLYVGFGGPDDRATPRAPNSEQTRRIEDMDDQSTTPTASKIATKVPNQGQQVQDSIPFRRPL